jgi:tetratricopeptide (TPR) repeat protein
MPLAIELAAARLRSMSLADLAVRLDQRFRLLTGGSRTALERQQTLRAAIGWSYALLTSAEQVLLARLSVFAGSFDLAAAEAVCGHGDIDSLEVADLLGSLADKSLAVTEPAGSSMRYRLLETIRLFATERLAEAGDGQQAAVVRAEHCVHYLAVAEKAAPFLTGPDQGEWLVRLHADQANLRHAAQHAAAEPDGTALMLRLAVALERYWEARSLHKEAAALLKSALQRSDARADPALFAAALVIAADYTLFTDMATAREFAKQAVQVARGLDDDRLLIRGLAGLCRACGRAGEPEKGFPYGQEAVLRARERGDDVLLAESLLYLSTTNLAQSGQLLEAIACTERSGDYLTNCSLHHMAGESALRAGNIPAARAHLEAAAQAAQALGYQSGTVTAGLGMALRADGDSDAAQATFRAALRISRRNGDNRGMAHAILGLACSAGDAGDWNRAGLLHGVAQTFLDRAGSAWEARDYQDNLDHARAQMGNEQLEQTYARGMTLSIDQAIDLALGPALLLSRTQPEQGER